MPKDVDLSTRLTRSIALNVPLVSAAMDTVTQAPMAIAMALQGGIGIVHKNMTAADQASEVRTVKKYESGVIREPVTVAPGVSVQDVMQITRAHNISGVPVVDGNRLVGIVTSRDLRFETRMDAPVSSIMTPKERLVTVREGAGREEVVGLLHKHRIEKVLVVNDAFELRGLITVKDIQKKIDYPSTCSDENGRLRAELLEAKRGAAESVRFQHLLGLRNAVTAETLVARVIAIDVSPYFRVARVRLDRGESLVQRGMPVITPEGVVGRINRTSGETSDIMLSVDPRSAIDIVLPRTGGRGILKGKPGENGYRCAIEYLMQGEQAKEGDLAVTSGLGGFPRDLPVGHISKIVKSASGLTQDIEITPDVDFARLSEVLVVVAPAPPPDPEAGPHKPLVPAHGLAVYH